MTTKDNQSNKTWLTLTDCAAITGKSLSFFRENCQDGKLPHNDNAGKKPRYLIHINDLNQFMKQYRSRLKSNKLRRAPQFAPSRPKCKRCEIILALAPEGYTDDMCNYCIP